LPRRSDVRRAEQQLASQSADIGIAKADIFSSFVLFGVISLASQDFDDLFNSSSLESFV